ncbi:unnamed protein product [Hapterophycus canaliculatus]
MRVVLRGQSSFYHNDVCARLFLSTEEANELYAANKQDVWATCIHPDDHKPFFDSLSMQLFGAPGHQSEFRNVYKITWAGYSSLWFTFGTSFGTRETMPLSG